ncbi:PRC-barrel domain-containing protein [Rhizosaccharibacter radicis]|uniref:PRC-barrel domain-containing protein n=1 Tax=Rhizosaccharibacter radicis TaxID=2782605 RepID=A0ABT1VUU6_9PROT|nr:PRC-barrel domain-containing protein [Acetobacteraceae bacterium KSS12]
MRPTFGRSVLAAAAGLALLSGTALAQQNGSSTVNTTPAAANGPDATAPSAKSAAGNDTTSKVTRDGFLRAGKLIGSDVYNSGDTSIGTLDDLLLSEREKPAMAVVSVGGFLGIGSKLVEVPFSRLKVNKAGHLVLPGATKDSLNKLHGYDYDK